MIARRAATLAGLLAAVGLAAAPVRAAPVEAGRYRLELRPQVEPVPVGRFHAWRLHLERSDGLPLELRHLQVDGGMPAHGHGLPTVPRIARGAGPNDFAVEGVRFQMAGSWELRVLIVDREGSLLVPVPVEVGVVARAARAQLWSATEREVLRSLSLARLGPPPPDPTNRVADDPRAAALGEQLFGDPGLSGDGTRACASCHRPALLFTDGRARARGERDLPRHTPGLLGAGHGRWFFWDGRRDSLWSQALDPIESPDEMHGTRVGALRHVAQHARAGYEALFGPLPALDGLAAQASPVGDAAAQAAWARVPPERREAITRAFTNLGKALAAYERQLRPEAAPFDRYVDAVLSGDDDRAAATLGPGAVAGLKLFLSPEAQCTRCHSGPLFTNGEFANVGTASTDPDHPDFGRAIGIQALLSTEFNCLGPYSDDPGHACPELTFLARHEENGSLLGAFKVPSLRNVGRTAPYMHDGRYSTLAEVIAHYRSPGPGAIEFRPLFDMTPRQAEELVAFLRTLDAEGPAAPQER